MERGNFVSADSIIDEILGDTYDDSGIMREKCYKWLFRVWKQITQDFLRRTRYVILPVNPLTKTVELPGDCADYVTVGYVECGNIRHLNINSNLAPSTITDTRVCKSCGQVDLCSSDYETIREEVTVDDMPDEFTSPLLYCMNTSTYFEYNMLFSRIYKPGFSNASISQIVAPASDVLAELTTYNWKNYLNINPHNLSGPANRSGVWTADCQTGQIAPPTKGTEVTIELLYDNTAGAERVVYAGCFGDNEFTLIVNQEEIARTNYLWTNVAHMRIFHLFPVTLKGGQLNRFLIKGEGGGGNADALGMIVYDNTADELAAATMNNDPDGESADLTVLLTTRSLRGGGMTSYGCPPGWELVIRRDGSYACRKKEKVPGLFQKVTTRRIDCDGSYLQEVTEPVVMYDRNGEAVRIEMQTTTKKICDLTISPCGCIAPSDANISILLESGCSLPVCCNSRNLPMGFNSSCMGTIRVFLEEGFIQLSPDSPLDSVYLAYITNAMTSGGISYFPEDTEEALIAGTYFRSIEKKINIAGQEKERARKAFNTQLTHMHRRLTRQSLQEMLNIFDQNPRFIRK